ELDGGEHIGEGRAGDDAVEQAGIIAGDLDLLVRAAGSAASEGEERHAVGFDETLLDHHHGFGGGDVLAVVAEDVEPGAWQCVSFADDRITADAAAGEAHAGALPVPSGGAAAAEGIEQAAIPGGGWRERTEVWLGGGVVEESDLVDGAVDSARFDAHDVR